MTDQTIPQSNALSEAKADSLGELMSRDPEGYTRQDLDRIIGVMRDQGARHKAAQEALNGKAPKQPKVGDPTAVASTSADDLGV